MQENGFQRQQLVRLNVGQAPFTLLRETINKYPASFLAQQVEKYSDLVDNGEYLYIDRDPKTFPWIAEIYRDGDIKGCLPSMSAKDLRKELRFYGLPSLSKLGIQSATEENPVPCGDVSPIKNLFLEILGEINRAGLLYFLPVDVFVYSEVKEGVSEGSEMKKMVVPHSELGPSYSTHRDHGTFVSTVLDGNKSAHQLCSWGKKLSVSNAKTEFWLIDFKDDVKLQLMNREADRFDMQCTTRSQPFGPEGSELNINILSIEYKSQYS